MGGPLRRRRARRSIGAGALLTLGACLVLLQLEKVCARLRLACLAFAHWGSAAAAWRSQAAPRALTQPSHNSHGVHSPHARLRGVASTPRLAGLPQLRPTPGRRVTQLPRPAPLRTLRQQRRAADVCGVGFFSELEDRPLYEGWRRLQSQASWDFLLGASPFSYDDGVANARRLEYMDNLVWNDGVWELNVTDATGVAGSEYSPSFISYLSRLLLARDERCAAWWSAACSNGVEAPELVFVRFQASVAAALSRDWKGRAGGLAESLIKRFANRFPFDTFRQLRLCFSQLPERVLQNSYFDQDFDSDRDELQEVFDVMDEDSNGFLTRTEIRKTLQKLGDNPSSNEITMMLGDASANGKGEIDLAGFKKAISDSLAAPRARAELGIPEDEWWRDPAALLPASLLDDASPSTLQEAHAKFFWGVGDSKIPAEELNTTSAEAAPPTLDIDTTPLPGVKPLMRERPLSWKVYGLFVAAGALACTLTHVALVPIDVVKTMQQLYPRKFRGVGLVGNILRMWRTHGPSQLFLGLVPTLCGYAWYGATVFPGYELFKRRLLVLVGPRTGAKLRVPLVLLAGALATFFACIGVCPAEALRIRAVTEGGFSMTMVQTLGITALFAGFVPLLCRQVLFGMAKFLVFDTFAANVYRRFPGFARRKRTAMLVSLVSGATAGVIATFVSQPSDAILTRLATQPSLGIAGAAVSLWSEGGPAAFFVGFIVRSVWAGAIIGGQFVLYDIAKHVFKVTAADLTQTADAITTAISSPTALPVVGATQRSRPFREPHRTSRSPSQSKAREGAPA